MATSPYISQKVRSEQSLYEDIVIESLKFYGQDVYYIPREIVNKDKVFLDDVPSRFSDSYKIEMYIENTEGFEGEGDLFTKFGIELRDQATFVVARRRWKQLVGNFLDTNNFRPREGDVIYLPLSESIFQIIKVETETPFYQLSQLPTFRLQAELFEYSDEDFDTGIDDLDNIEYEGAFQYKLTMRDRLGTGSTSSLPAATSTIDLAGQVDSITSTVAGRGYTTAPTITFPLPDGDSDNAKFGANSLNMTLAQGIEGNFPYQADRGILDLFVNVSEYPNTGEFASLFLTGGDSTGDQYMWGINENGGLVYQRGSGMSTPVGVGSQTLTRGSYTNIAIGVDSSELHVWLNGSKILDSDAGYSTKLAGTNGFSFGATATRTFGGTNWVGPRGRMDEIRVREGDPESYALTGVGGNGFSVPSSASDSDSITVFLDHLDGRRATATATIDATTGSITGYTITDGGFLYSSAPTPTFSAPDSGGDFVVGEVVTQVNTNYTIKGEVTDWSDSDRVLQLAHVGSTDGKYREFSLNRKVQGANASWVPSLVEELQNIQQEAQNKIFDDFEGDFLDFSEGNPFGDMD